MKRTILSIAGLLLFWGLQAQQVTEVFDVVIKNEDKINSEELEFSPAFYENGILFISTREDNFKFLDRRLRDHTMGIYLARRNSDGSLGKPELYANRLNTKYHEGPLTFDMSGNTMYFTRSNYVNGRVQKSEDGWVKLRILKATKEGDNWDQVQDLPFNGNEFETCHPSITPESNRLYFSSDRPGGQGGMDIYYVDKSGDDWGDPVNLGPAVNTEGDEIFPFIHADGTLFFSSDSRDGLGKLDIYFTRENAGGTWKEAKNLGEPFNSEADDFGMIVDLETKNGYFSSDRKNGQGKDDIYNFYASKGLNTLLANKDMIAASQPRGFRVYVADQETGAELEGARVVFLDMDELNLSNILTVRDDQGNLIRIQAPDPNSDELILKVEPADAEVSGLTDTEGLYAADISPSNYVVSVNAPGYFPKQVPVEKSAGLDEIMVLLSPMGDAVPFNGMVLDPRFNTPMGGAKVTIQEEGSSEQVVLYTDQNGQFEYYLPRDKDYTVTIEKDGQKATRQITTKDMGENEELAMAFDITDPNGRNPFAAGTVIQMPNIYYNFNDASIRPDAQTDLDALATILQQFPELRVELASHTDSRGGTRYNEKLSQRRAESAQAYLADKGIDAERTVPKGYGESQLKNNCSDGIPCSEYDHQVNRRTEFRILGEPMVEVDYLDNPPSQVDKAGKPAKTSKSSPATTSSSKSTTKGRFVVIAGTFKVPGNADKRLAQVKAAGFDRAELFATGNGMTAVRAGVYEDRKVAAAKVAELEGTHKINAYFRRI